ncbi:MAG: CPBP family glutamic-type intramembrane protease, partial [Promethearchaeota archaeon]
LLIELILASISIEIAFRGVLHNTLKERFNDNKISGKILISTIVALVYSVFFLALSFPIGIYFLIPNFLIFLLLGMLYEINDNIYNTIIALILYNVLMITLIIYI